MGNLDELLTQAFIRFGKIFTKASIIVEGTIIDVDATAFTCTVNIQNNENGGVIDNQYFNVPLKVLKGSQASLIEIPAVNSACTLTFKDNNVQRPQLYQVDQCSKLLVSIGLTTLEINTGKDSNGNDIAGTVFNGGSLGGLIKVSDSVDRFNKIEQDINNLKSILTTWVPVPSDGGAALKLLLATYNSVSLTQTTKDMIEDKKVTH